MQGVQIYPILDFLNGEHQGSQRSIIVRLLLLLALAIAFYLPSTSFAQALDSQRYSVHIDTDDSATGCTSTVEDASGSKTLSGIDYRVDIDTTQSTAGATANSVTLIACNAGVWGNPSKLEAGPRKLASSEISGKFIEHIEAAIPMAQLAVKPGQYLTLNISSSGDYLISPVSGQGNGSIGLTVPNPQVSSATPVPLMSAALIAVLAAAMAMAGWWGIRTGRIKGNAVVAICTIVLASSALVTGVVSAANAFTKISIHDTSIADWAGISTLAIDPEGDNVLNTPDLMALYGAISDGQLFIRIDVNAGRKDGDGPVISGNRDLSPFEKASDLPRFVSVPSLTAQVNADWKYQVRAVDGQGSSVSVEVVSSTTPSGVAVSGVAPDQLVQWTPSAAGMHRVTLLARDRNGKTQIQQFLVGVSDDSKIPPDPKTRATPLAPNVLTPFSDSTKFLYDDTDPIQKGVVAGTIDPVRVAVLRGKIMDKSGAPLAGATIKIQDHPEYGYTQTRADGWYDIAVNGGGWLTVHVEKTGYLSAQRKVNTPWRDWAFADDVVLIPFDNQYSQIDLTRNELQTYWGGENTDHRGARRTTIVFPAGTKAVAEMADGSTQNLEQLTVRVSEYTIGANGPQTMPGELPVSVGYTWAANYSVDEAEALGARHVRFNKPVYSYTTNFIEAPVGTAVPSGWYDFNQAAWVGSDNGRVVQILAVAGGQAVLRVTQENRQATPEELSVLGIKDDELTALANMYPTGTQLWRTPLEHFTAWDYNWPWGPPEDVPPPPEDGPPPEGPPPPDLPPDADNPENEEPAIDEPGEDIECGCDVYIKQRAVGQSIPLKGTPFSLYYRSDVSGKNGYNNSTALRTRVKTANFTAPSTLNYATAEYQIAGKIFKKQWTGSQLSTTPEFDENKWDGTDAYGRTVVNYSTLRTSVSYGYQAVYYEVRGNFTRAFERISTPSSKGISFSRSISGSNPTINIRKEKATRLINPSKDISIAQANIGGWMLQGLRFFDADKKVILESNGTPKNANSMTVGQKPLKTSIQWSGAKAILLSDGRILEPIGTKIYIYAVDNFDWKDYNVFAGTDSSGFSGDGGPAALAQFGQISNISESIDGSIYVMDSGNGRLRKISKNGNVHTVAGNGNLSAIIPNGVSLKAKETGFNAKSIAHMPDGNILAVTDKNQLVQLTASGYLSVISLPEIPKIVTSSTDGEAWIVTDPGSMQKLYKLRKNSSIDLIAFLTLVNDAAPGANGSLLIPNGTKLISVSSSGVIKTIVDTNNYETSFSLILSHVIGHHSEIGYLYYTQYGNVIKASAGFPEFTGSTKYLVGTSSGIQYEEFLPNGTPSALRSVFTGAKVASHSYNADGNLSSITDAYNNEIKIERTANNISRIIGQDGEVTTLSYNGNGLLSKVVEQGGASHTLVYNPQGLLSEYHDPNGGVDKFTYDTNGKLSSTKASDGSGWSISKDKNNSIKATTAEGNSKTVNQIYRDGFYNKSTIGFDGIESVKEGNPSNGYYSSTTPSTIIRTTKFNDPVFGSASPIESKYLATGGFNSRFTEVRNASWDGEKMLGWSSSSSINNATWKKTFSNLGYPTFEFTGPNSEYRRTEYNELMRPLYTDTETGSHIRYSYDSKGKTSRLEERDYNGKTRSIDVSYHPNGSNGMGKVSKIINNIGQESSYQYNSAGQVIKHTLPDGRATSYVYDPIGNVIKITTPSGNIHTFSYNFSNQPATYNSPQSATQWTYDLEKKPLKIVRPGGAQVNFVYDNSARLKSIDSDAGSTLIQYNALGQEESISNANQKISFQRKGDILTKKEYSGVVNGSINYDISHNALLKKISIKSASDATELSIEGDSSGRIYKIGDFRTYYNNVGLISGFGNEESGVDYFRNEFGEYTSSRYYTKSLLNPPDSEATRVRLLAQIRALRDALSYEISEKNTCRLRGWNIYTRYIYAISEISKINDEYQGWIWEYDTPGLNEEDRIYFNIKYGAPKYRDPELCLEIIKNKISDIERDVVHDASSVYWIKGRINDLKTATAGGAKGVSELDYRAAGAVVDEASYNTSAVLLIYAEINKLISDFENSTHYSNFPFEFNYERDALGRINGQTERILSNIQIHSYDYDAAGRLIQHTKDGTPTTWQYDANGNRTHENGSSIATYDTEDKFLNWKSNSYQYTAAGDLKQKSNASGTTTYQYDSLGNLQKVTLADNSQIEYVIDPSNRRIGKKKNGVMQHGLLYQDQLRPIAQTKPGGGIHSVFIYGDKFNVPSAMLQDGKKFRIISDHLGSVRLVVDEQTSEIKQQIEYDVWGQIVSDSNPGFQPFGFAGGLYDPDTSLTRFGARDYDAETGRWTAKDPILFDGEDTNLYGYVIQDPVNFIDPDGRARFGGRGKGERGRTAKADGTDNPFKHTRLDPKDPTKILQKDADGKWIKKNKPDGYDEAVKRKQKGEIQDDFLEKMLPWPLLPSELTCSTMDCHYTWDPCSKTWNKK